MWKAVPAMHAVDVMTRPVLTVRDDDHVEQAAALLAHNNVTAAPVLNPQGELVGVVSEGDLLRARVVQVPHPEYPSVTAPAARFVSDVMTSDVVTLPAEADLSAVADAMLTHGVHSVPIVDGTEVVGIVCRHDLLRLYVRTDDRVQWDVQRRLDQYAGDKRIWTAIVHNGIVEISGEYVDEIQHKVVEVLARTVPGVTTVTAAQVR
jgi:CBS domain-containing protein